MYSIWVNDIRNFFLVIKVFVCSINLYYKDIIINICVFSKIKVKWGFVKKLRCEFIGGSNVYIKYNVGIKILWSFEVLYKNY